MVTRHAPQMSFVPDTAAFTDDFPLTITHRPTRRALPQRMTTNNKWPDPIAAHTAVGGFWRTDHTFASELHLKNNLEVNSIEVLPVLRMADGTQFSLHPIVLEPSGVAVVDINHELAALPRELEAHRSEYGVVDVRYS
jgi:hypothetical protein